MGTQPTCGPLLLHQEPESSPTKKGTPPLRGDTTTSPGASPCPKCQLYTDPIVRTSIPKRRHLLHSPGFPLASSPHAHLALDSPTGPPYAPLHGIWCVLILKRGAPLRSPATWLALPPHLRYHLVILPSLRRSSDVHGSRCPSSIDAGALEEGTLVQGGRCIATLALYSFTHPEHFSSSVAAAAQERRTAMPQLRLFHTDLHVHQCVVDFLGFGPPASPDAAPRGRRARRRASREER